MAPWDTLTSLFEGQGTVFWLAAAAASLGVSLLVCAAILTVRRRLQRRERPSATPPASGLENLVRATESGYAPASTTGRAPEAPIDADPGLKPLLERLRKAGDRLAILQDIPASADSDLKGSAKDVDDVFKSGVA